jgi:hypothetical protein
LRGIEQRAQLASFGSRIRREMGAAHEAESDDANAEHPAT